MMRRPSLQALADPLSQKSFTVDASMPSHRHIYTQSEDDSASNAHSLVASNGQTRKSLEQAELKALLQVHVFFHDLI